MDLVSSAEFQRRPGRYQDRALVEPVLANSVGIASEAEQLAQNVPNVQQVLNELDVKR